SNSRPTMFCQNQVLVSVMVFSRPNHEFSTPAMIGSATAQRNGLERAKLEHSSSQPTLGSAHSALTGMISTSLNHKANRWVGDHSSGNGLIPCSSAYRLIST